ncbi:MAG: glycosyltransferase family 39 protein [Candidatus Melainabacteria bacterium]|nr:glycosyltransferase family 39 protein [Candidatus Melainabacteria bacterium]
MINSNSVIRILVTAWFIVAYIYLSHTPIDHRSHDLWGHVEYTKIIVTKHWLPTPREGSHTFHPPLYYLINSFIRPDKLITDINGHVNSFRWLSVLYGAMTIYVIWMFLVDIKVNPLVQLITLLFIATTPAFVFLFSTYNNDSIAMFLSIAAVATSYKLYLRWSLKLALVLTLIATLGIYSKYTSISCIASLILLCLLLILKNILKKESLNKSHVKVSAVLIISMILFIPWAMRNQHYNEM